MQKRLTTVKRTIVSLFLGLIMLMQLSSVFEVNGATTYGCYELEISGDLLFYVNHYGLYIYDISNPEEPLYQKVVYLEHLGDQTKIVVNDNIAYISDTLANINLINCHDIGNAAKFTSILVGDYFDEVSTFDVNGDFLYALVEGILKVYNMTDLGSPTLVDTYGNETYQLSDFHIDNDRLYMLHSTHGFDILDLTNPANLTTLGIWHTEGNYLSLFKDTHHLYLLDGNKDMNIFSVSSPTNPFKLDVFTVDLPSDFIDFTIKGGRLFVLNNLGFEFYDVSSLYNDQFLGEYQRENTDLDFTGIDIQGNYVFMTSDYSTYDGYLYLIDITNPDEPDQVLPGNRPWYWGSMIFSIIMSLVYYVIPALIVALIVFFVVRYFRRRDRKEFKDIEKVAIQRKKKEYWEKEH